MADPAQNRRRKLRIGVRFRAEFHGRRAQGGGVVLNISESGALIGEAQPLLVAGGRIRVRFSFLEDSLPVELPAKVVRETEDGFAISFLDTEPRTKNLLRIAISRARRRIQELEEMPGADDEDNTLTALIE